MGNRGSKSGIMPVKEQRVDDSWFIKHKLINLRCTLMDFERYYQVKILSKQLKFKINFSTLVKNLSLILPCFCLPVTCLPCICLCPMVIDQRENRENDARL